MIKGSDINRMLELVKIFSKKNDHNLKFIYRLSKLYMKNPILHNF